MRSHQRRFSDRGAVFAIIVCITSASSVGAQTQYTWTGGGGNAFWLDANNWNPTSGPPGVAGSTGNQDVALFGNPGATVDFFSPSGGFNLGAIATNGGSGGTLVANFSQNDALRLNGSYTVGTFTNVAAAAQGRDLKIAISNMQFHYGSAGLPTTFYAEAGRTLTIEVSNQQVTNFGGNVNKEGTGTLIVSLGVFPTLADVHALGAGANLNINGGTFATNGTLNLNGGIINVASGAALQAGLLPTGDLSTNATIAFQSGGGLKVVTDGTSVSKLLNANISKGTSDIFRIIIAPTQLGEFNLTTKTLLQGNLSGFANGTFTQGAPGTYEVVGDGFTITNWSLTVQNGNEIQLNSITVTPVPEPGTVLLIGVAGLAAAGAVRRRLGLRPVNP